MYFVVLLITAFNFKDANNNINLSTKHMKVD